MTKIGPKEAARRKLRETGVTINGKPLYKADGEPVETGRVVTVAPAVSDPEAQDGHNAYMRTYMQRWRRGEVGRKHRKPE